MPRQRQTIKAKAADAAAEAAEAIKAVEEAVASAVVLQAVAGAIFKAAEATAAAGDIIHPRSRTPIRHPMAVAKATTTTRANKAKPMTMGAILALTEVIFRIL